MTLEAQMTVKIGAEPRLGILPSDLPSKSFAWRRWQAIDGESFFGRFFHFSIVASDLAAHGDRRR
jgi:hypothetical protein